MSLINRMLQDLDQRGSAAVANDVAHAHIRAVPERGSKLRLVWGAALLLMALSGAAGLFWRQAVPAAAKPAVSVQPSHVLPRTGNMRMSLAIAPDQLALQEKTAAVSLPAAAAVPDLLAGKALETKPAPVKSVMGAMPGKPPVAAVPLQFSAASSPLVSAMAALPGRAHTGLQASVVPRADRMRSETPASPPNPSPARGRGERSESLRDFHAKADQDGTEFKQAKEVTPQQTTENAYRKALSLIDAAQLPEAIGALEQVLQFNPKHAAARQTLVGLLLEGKRQDDAVRRLQEGLSIDPAQSGMAMILARLQVERGNQRPALETLQRSLPHAADQADYQAFLAALLQRDKRHKEAAEHYALALRKAPQNGLWWMGYGISLQADNRLSEAQDAFTRARASTMLSAELQAFVDQKLSQMQR